MADSSARSSSRSTDLSTPVNDQPSSSSVSKKKAKKPSKSGKKEEDPGNCFCKSKKGGFVILCDGCDRWCHPACVGIPHEIQKALDTSSTYLCPLCVLKKFSKEQVIRVKKLVGLPPPALELLASYSLSKRILCACTHTHTHTTH